MANGVGFILILGTIVLSYGLITLPFLPDTSFYFMFVFYLVMTSLFILIVIFIWPTLISCQTTFINYFKYALLIGLSNLHYGLLFVISLLVIHFLFSTFPGLVLFFSISLPCLILMHITIKVVCKIEDKASVIQQTQ